MDAEVSTYTFLTMIIEESVCFMSCEPFLLCAIILIRPAVENQTIKCNEHMGYTPTSYVIGKRNDGTLRIMMP